MKIFVVNAFVDSGEGGNPAGVVLEADTLTSGHKQIIAEKVSLSETAFVSQSQNAAFKLDFFTPVRQIPHCGHATIAAFCLLQQLGKLEGSHTSKETVDGIRDIFISGQMVFMEQLAPKYVALSPDQISGTLSSLHIKQEDLLADTEPCIVDTGNPFLIIPLRDSSIVRGVEPDFAAITHISKELGAMGYYVFSLLPEKHGRIAGTRMFAPLYGINEEAATGMAAGPLACFLHDKLNVQSTNMLIEQGHWMEPPSPSVLVAKLELYGGSIQKCLVGGEAKVMQELEI